MKSDILFSEFQSGEMWAMEPNALERLRCILSLRSTEILSFARTEPTARNYKIDGSTAIVPITGVLMKSVPWYYSLLGIDAMAHGDIVSMIERASSDPEIKSILLDIDSPGGQVAGQVEAANAIKDARNLKEMSVRVNDLCASGAYWLASQGGKITAGPNAMIGSIGVYAYYYDSSKAAEDQGIKAVVVRSGEHKGMGIDGAKITDTQIQAMQEVIDGMAGNFVAAVSEGRGKSIDQVKLLATGQSWIASAAKSNGLIDEVVNPKSSTIQKGIKKMEEQKSKVDADAIRNEAVASEKKRLGDLKAAFPNDLPFAMSQFEAGSSVKDAQAAYCAVLMKQNSDLTKQVEAQATDTTPPAGAPPAKNTGAAVAGSTNKDFVSQARDRAKERNITVTQAMQELVRMDPEGHHKWVEAQGPVPVI